MRRPAYPGLYDVQADNPTLSGTRCSGCGRVYFPPLTIGCEACGATAEYLIPIPVEASGTVHSLPQVHVHRGQPPAPFTIAEIRLDDGLSSAALSAVMPTGYASATPSGRYGPWSPPRTTAMRSSSPTS
jgi:uncharacterized OB-fold protein